MLCDFVIAILILKDYFVGGGHCNVDCVDQKHPTNFNILMHNFPVHPRNTSSLRVTMILHATICKLIWVELLLAGYYINVRLARKG